MIAWANNRPHGSDPLEKAYYYALKSTQECAFAMLELVVSACVLVLHILFSTRRSTRHAMFWLHNVALVATICFGWLSIRQIVLDLEKLRNGLEPAPFTIEFILPQAMSPWVADLTLILRVAAFYPSTTTPLRERVAVLIFPAVFQTARIPMFVTQHYAGHRLPGQPWHYIAIEYAYNSLHAVRTFLSLQTNLSLTSHIPLCSAYCAIFLLRRSWRFNRLTKQRAGAHDRPFQRRFRWLVEVVAGSYAAPVLLHFALLISTIVMGAKDFDDVSVVVYALFDILNLTFSAPLAVLATSWSTIHTTQEQRMVDELNVQTPRNTSTTILLGEVRTPNDSFSTSTTKDESILTPTQTRTQRRTRTRRHPDDVTLLDWITGAAEEEGDCEEAEEEMRTVHSSGHDVDLEEASDKLRERRGMRR